MSKPQELVTENKKEEDTSPTKRLKLQHVVEEAEIIRVIETALKEDLSDRGDITTLSTVPKEQISHAYLLAKANGVVSGTNVVNKVFEFIDEKVTLNWHKKNGDIVQPGDKICDIKGRSQSILTGERIALNIMQR
ncbi:hypothetical protein RFI_00794 [Reticulomyxa filosa]|uniref:nicotinate-nucleotide diphosphorylase (carboxylating) n=1 Tax=Reticulomyxa filosa TaxID=46433 RepID=X6PDH9_RETFI|nr:hypothetical protein RFI_00794 [Reticulomyxa filosa]|eukprot:ETO36261.1 hypothetical protein RFI_00794 [Reticulomyxa filosa]